MRFSLANVDGDGATTIFSVEEMVGRVMTLLWFAFTAFLQVSRITAHLIHADTHPIHVLDLTKNVMGLAFSLLAIALTLSRRQSKATATGLEPRIVAVLGTYLMVLIPLLPTAHVGNFWETLAIGLITVGILSSLYCLSWLGRSYSIMTTARNLVMAGPYGIVRHPLYASECLSLLGIIIADFSPFAVAIGLTTIGLLWRRVINEERLLTSVFPEYEEYAQRVPRIVPLILTGGLLKPAPAGAVFGS